MNLTYTISTHVRNPIAPQLGGVSQDVFDSLGATFPEGRNGKSTFVLRAEEGDERISALESLLNMRGVPMQRDRSERYPCVSVTIARSYSDEELDAFEYFQVYPTFPKGEALKADGVCPKLNGGSDLETTTGPIGFLSPYWWVVCCDNSARDSLEEQSFSGLELLSLSDPSAMWLLWSAVRMGNIQNLCFDNLGNKFSATDATNDQPNGCQPLEGNIGTPSLIYRREDCASIDVALTKERFSPGKKLQSWPSLIVSRKVRRFLSRFPGVGFVPIHLLD
jgi:hypothetical protein